MVRAWAPDGYKGANPPECLEVRVLLTRNQLMQLARARGELRPSEPRERAGRPHLAANAALGEQR